MVELVQLQTLVPVSAALRAINVNKVNKLLVR